MKKFRTFDICLCGIMTAIHIVLEVVPFLTIVSNEWKITFSALPFIILAAFESPFVTFMGALVGNFLSQLILWGFSWTDFVWMIPPAIQALTMCLIYRQIKKKQHSGVKKRVMLTGAAIYAAGFVLVVFNWLASLFETVLINRYMTIEALIVTIPARLAIWVLLSAALTAISCPVIKAIRRAFPGEKNGGKA